MKKFLLTVLTLVTVAVVSIVGTVAYLTWEDSDVNVMTTGNVQIDQIEQQRDANGNLVAFTQGQDILPAVYETIAWADAADYPVPADYEVKANADGNEWRVFSSDMKNVLDKFVTVKNVGTIPAFVRTIVAIEMPDEQGEDYYYNHIHWNDNSSRPAIDGTEIGMTTIDGVRYYLYEYVYVDAVAAGETTIPSLKQVFLDKAMDNAEVEKFGETWDILVVSQGVQAAGFTDAKTALNEAFGVITANDHPWIVTTEVDTFDELKTALAAGDKVRLTADIEGDGETIVIGSNNEAVTLDLNGYTLTNAVAGAPAILNYGKLTVTGNGSIVNGVSTQKKSHTIHNYGELTIDSGNIGTFETAGAAIVNDGDVTVNGGTFASKQENVKADGLCAYVFINNGEGTMTINNAVVNGQTHGLFGAYNGNIVVNGGNYTLDGNGGLGCYVVYATGDAVVTLNGGVVYTYEPRHHRVYFVYDNGNYFNDAAVATGKIVENGTKVYLNAKTVDVTGEDKAAVVAAINNANPGDTVKLTEDTTIAGFGGTNKLTIEKDIVLDLNGKTLTTECGWGGLDAKGGCSIKNGTINHTGNTAAIKAFQVESIENVTINVTQTEGKTKGGIVVQNSDGCYVGSIKNVTINGATNGIECYRSNREVAIGVIDNVKIDATDNGIYLNGAGRIGKITNSEIKGGNIGINAYLANLWHISLDIENSSIIGGTTGIDIWDEAKTNTGSTVSLKYDTASTFTGGIKVTLQKEISCTVNGVTQTTPCDIRIQ